jgi:hypothetical protein
LGCLLRTKEKYIKAKAASNTPPNIKIKVVTICSPISISKKSLVGVQRLIAHQREARQLSANFATPPELLWRMPYPIRSGSVLCQPTINLLACCANRLLS